MKVRVLKISQISQENTFVGVFFNKVTGLRPATLLNRGYNIGIFLRNLRKFSEQLF